jgi:hypothetical protein
VIDPAAGNQLTCGPNGLLVPAAPPGTVDVADSTCITLTGDGSAGAPLTAAPVIDPAAGNQLACGPNGLLVPAADPLSIGCGLLGSGTAADPLVAAVSGTWPLADRIGQAFPCADTNTTSEIYCASDGTLHSRPEGTTVLGFITQNETPGVVLTTGQSRSFAAQATFVNFSTCRYMHILGVARLSWDLLITQGTEWQVYGTSLEVVSPAPAAGPILARDRWDSPTTKRWRYSGPQVGHVLNVPPGTTITFEVRVDVQVLAGSLTVTEQRVDAKWHGTTI